jgi:hypothetical protein
MFAGWHIPLFDKLKRAACSSQRSGSDEYVSFIYLCQDLCYAKAKLQRRLLETPALVIHSRMQQPRRIV